MMDCGCSPGIPRLANPASVEGVGESGAGTGAGASGLDEGGRPPNGPPGSRGGVLVKSRVPNADHRLKPGMFANLDLTLKTKDDAVVIPESALILSGDTVSVFIVDEKQTAQIRIVKVGVRMQGQVEITDGLKGGEQVIVEGFQKTRPGAPVKVVTRAESLANGK